MKFSTSFSSLLVVILPLLLEAAALPNGFGGGFGGSRANQGAGGRFGGNNQNQNQKGTGSQQGKGNNNANGAASSTASAASSTATSTASSNATSTASTASNNNNNAANSNNNANNNANSDSNPQTSLTLDPSVIGPGYAQNGLNANGSEAGEVASLTSTNNFINFCIGQTIQDGIQLSTPSCNPIPMGQIPDRNNIPSCKFTSPVNGQNIAENTTFTISMNIQNLQTGNFVDADSNFLGAPQQVASSGQVIGHSHVVVQKINSFTDTTPANPLVFAFFKGLNEAAQGGVLSTEVTGGLAEGTYRVASINTAANHQPVLAPIAQHGSVDDAVYFTVGSAGAGQSFGNAGAAAAGGATGAAAAGGANNAAAAGAASGAAAGTASGAANNATAGGANGAAATGANGAAAASASGAAAKGANGAASGNAGGAAAKGGNGAAAKGTNGAAAKGANGATTSANGANNANAKGANNAQAGGATKAAGGAKQQQPGKGRRSFTISRQN